MEKQYEMTSEELKAYISSMEEDTTVIVIIEREDSDGEEG